MEARGADVTPLLLGHPRRYGEIAMHWAVAGAGSPEEDIRKADEAFALRDDCPQYPLPLAEEITEGQPVEHPLAS